MNADDLVVADEPANTSRVIVSDSLGSIPGVSSFISRPPARSIPAIQRRELGTAFDRPPKTHLLWRALDAWFDMAPSLRYGAVASLAIVIFVVVVVALHSSSSPGPELVYAPRPSPTLASADVAEDFPTSITDPVRPAEPEVRESEPAAPSHRAPPRQRHRHRSSRHRQGRHGHGRHA